MSPTNRSRLLLYIDQTALTQMHAYTHRRPMKASHRLLLSFGFTASPLFLSASQDTNSPVCTDNWVTVPLSVTVIRLFLAWELSQKPLLVARFCQRCLPYRKLLPFFLSSRTVAAERVNNGRKHKHIYLPVHIQGALRVDTDAYSKEYQ